MSHACVLASNQSVYAKLSDQFDVTLIVPKMWRDELRPTPYQSATSKEFFGEVVRVATWAIGRPQRHVARVRAVATLRRTKPDFVVIEEEPFSLSAIYWSRAARRLGVPYAVQIAENLSKALPAPIETACRRVLAGAAFVMGRSPAAVKLAQRWGYVGPATVVAHGYDPTETGAVSHPLGVVGFVGRLIATKGVDDLVAALTTHRELQLRVAGDGPLRVKLATLGTRVELLGTLAPEQMDQFYDSISVLAVPSRTTPSWSEQFGRVIIEAQGRGVPVVAYSSGEIPWVASLTAVELVAEGDVEGLGLAIERLATHGELARSTGERARHQVEANFTNAVIGRQLAALITSAAKTN